MIKKTLRIKSLSIALFVLALFALASCTKTDDRDQFVGTYRLNATGSYSMVINGETYTEPLSSGNNATLTITKSSNSENIVFVSGFYNTEADVVGNTITIDSETVTQTQDGITITMTISHNRGTLSGNTLTFTSNITGNAYYQGYSYPIHGNVSNVAYKQ
ncbi:MAG: hypothetical protein II471_02120 [Bacteroidales bacterium]|nr:hypothetical protein [Bacteroidales bacterium]